MFTIFDAAKYSIVPHDLGLCGPQENCSLILQGKNKKKIREVFEKFTPVVHYCKYIAKANGIKDYFDDRVLEAYWLGNDLLKKAQYKDGGYPHHSYHVWCCDPFNPAIKLNNKLKKICEVSVRQGYTYHWKRKIQKINKTQLKNLKYYTNINRCLKNK